MSSLNMDAAAMVAGVPVICARRTANERALCGAAPFSLWTDVKRYVTCRRCIAEIERRLTDPQWRSRRPLVTTRRKFERRQE